MSKRNKSYFNSRKSRGLKKSKNITALLMIDPLTDQYAIGFADEPEPRETGHIAYHPETGEHSFIPDIKGACCNG